MSFNFNENILKMKLKKVISGIGFLSALVLLLAHCTHKPFHTVHAAVAFDTTLQAWDGFGVNYVELAQSTDPVNDPQEYGGFSLLSEEKRSEIINLIFGEKGLKPSIIKMFFDPFQQKEPGLKFDHESTTKWMRYFALNGVKATEARGGDEIQIITTLYGPPAWATKQKFLRGRDLDPAQYQNLALYIIDWAKYLVEDQKLPVKFISLHNEGDSPNRWPLDGSSGNIGTGHDYNAFWRPTEVAHFLKFMPQMIKDAGLDVGMTPGECTTWASFANGFYNWAIYDDPDAIKNIALITSHGFGEGPVINSQANDLLRLKRPDLHAWTTSMTWGTRRMTHVYDFTNLIRRNIYDAKVNAVIPWACVQTLTWVGGDPNPGTAFFVSADGNYEVRPQYYFYKQLTTAGRPGMKVASVNVEPGTEQGINLIGFSSNGTKNPDAFIVLNLTGHSCDLSIRLTGTQSKVFRAFRSGEVDKYSDIGSFNVNDGKIEYTAPAGSVSTFFAE
jgi:O-glycosyl hydrolase